MSDSFGQNIVITEKESFNFVLVKCRKEYYLSSFIFSSKSFSFDPLNECNWNKKKNKANSFSQLFTP